MLTLQDRGRSRKSAAEVRTGQGRERRVRQTPRVADTHLKEASRAKKKVEDSSSEVKVLPEVTVRTKHPQGNWLKNTDWTDHLVEYLTDNSEFCRKLLSNLTAEAKREGHTKSTTKDGKSAQYGVLAKHIFEDDPQEQARYTNDPGKYATSVETRVPRLKRDYQKCVQRIGATGAGLDPTSVKEGTALASLIDEVQNGFPWWDVLYGFWRELLKLTRMGEKRKLQHTEEMEHMKIKRMKYEVKLLTAQNEQARLNHHATSQSPRCGTRALNHHLQNPGRDTTRCCLPGLSGLTHRTIHPARCRGRCLKVIQICFPGSRSWVWARGAAQWSMTPIYLPELAIMDNYTG
ncbi:hypothetical protein C8F04DRAFT_1186351 [Mycena alexandri]|uniref:Uncharacterized protein n=1 Tax=Mycena alexandri TaxID=1745969 RepID=A0AAD6SP85_9AGAR|nr:hypothetical protein C8F04DRAFT_1186351 [Mycena alexandri]